MKKKNVMSVIAFLCIIAVITSVLNRIFIRKSDLTVWNNFYSMEEDSIDVVILGSSIIGCAVDPYQLSAETHSSVYNLSVSGQGYVFHPTFLREVFKTQSPSLVIVETFRYLGDYNVDLDSAMNSVHGMKNSLNKFECMWNLPLSTESVNRVELFLPVLAHHNRWKDMKISDVTNLRGNTSEHVRWNDGGHASIEPQESIIPYTMEVGGIADTAKQYIDEMIEIATENHCELLFFNPPNPEYTEDSYRGLNAIYQYLDEKGVAHIECDAEEELVKWIDPSVDYCDYHHTNLAGTYKTTMFLAEYLNQTYQFHETDIQETKDYQGYLTDKKAGLLSASSINSYLFYLFFNEWEVTYYQDKEWNDDISMKLLDNFVQEQEMTGVTVGLDECFFVVCVKDKETGNIIDKAYILKEKPDVLLHMD